MFIDEDFWMRKKTVTHKEMFSRINIVDYLKKPDWEQKSILYGCLTKKRHETLEDAAAQMLKTYKLTKTVSLHYKCEHCGGYHLTTQIRGKKKKALVKIIKEMLDKKLMENKND